MLFRSYSTVEEIFPNLYPSMDSAINLLLYTDKGYTDVYKRQVLELATGTGLIAKHIVSAAAHIEATEASAETVSYTHLDVYKRQVLA